jgi:methylglutaconyl-CoA hydratase
LSAVRVERTAAGIVRVVLCRAEKRNALHRESLTGLRDALSVACADASTRVLTLTGEGPAFCAGMDLAEAADPTIGLELAELIRQVLSAFGSAPFVTLAGVQGAALAGGAGLATACDLVVAESDAKFGYPEVQRGLVASMVTVFLRRQVPERFARELLLLGEPVSADRASQIGLVNRVVPTGQLAAALVEWETKLLRCSPTAIAESKRLLGELWPRSLDDDLGAAHRHHLHVRTLPDFAEGLASFRDKRPPNWQP